MSRLDLLLQKQTGLCTIAIRVDGMMPVEEYAMSCTDAGCHRCIYNKKVRDWLCLD